MKLTEYPKGWVAGTVGDNIQVLKKSETKGIVGKDCYLIPAPVAAAADAGVEAVENSEEEWGYQMPDVWEALAAYRKEARDEGS